MKIFNNKAYIQLPQAFKGIPDVYLLLLTSRYFHFKTEYNHSTCVESCISIEL